MWQLCTGAMLAGDAQLVGIHGYRMHHFKAVLFHAGAGEMEHKTENDAKHNGNDGHVDADKLDAQAFDHTSITSRW